MVWRWIAELYRCICFDKHYQFACNSMGLVLIDTGKSESTAINESTGHIVISSNEAGQRPIDRKSWRQMLRELFNTSNVIEMLKTCGKKRPQHKHLHLRLYFISIGVYIFCVLGETTVAYQFAQLVYHWSAVYYSTARAIALILPTFMGIFWPYILQKWFHLGDAACGILGVSSAMFSFIIKGGILELYAFFLSSVIGAFASIFLPCLRSMISKSVNSDEIGQVFTLLGCIEATTPMLDGFYYSFIFSNTAGIYPGMVYHATIGIFLIPYLSILWIDLDRRHEEKLQLKKKVSSDLRKTQISETYRIFPGRGYNWLLRPFDLNWDCSFKRSSLRNMSRGHLMRRTWTWYLGLYQSIIPKIWFTIILVIIIIILE